LIADRPSTALLIPSKAVPLAGSVPNLDPRTTAQLTPAKLLHRVDPVIPDFAKEAGIDGTVLLSAVIGTDGKLKDVKFVSGDRALAIEAFRAVRDWRLRNPHMLQKLPDRVRRAFYPLSAQPWREAANGSLEVNVGAFETEQVQNVLLQRRVVHSNFLRDQFHHGATETRRKGQAAFEFHFLQVPLQLTPSRSVRGIFSES
jgi:hypothetical protein